MTQIIQIYYLTILEVEEVQKSKVNLTGLKTKLSAGLNSFLEALGENLFPFLFQLLEATFAWLVAPSSIFKPAMTSQLFLMWDCSDLPFCLPLQLLRTLLIILGPPR